LLPIDCKKRVASTAFHSTIFDNDKPIGKKSSTSLVGVESHPCSCGGVNGLLMKHGQITFYNMAISAIVRIGNSIEPFEIQKFTKLFCHPKQKMM